MDEEDEMFAASLGGGIFGDAGDDDYDDAFDEETVAAQEVASPHVQNPGAQSVGMAPMAFSGDEISPNASSSKLGAALSLFTFVGGGLAGWAYTKKPTGAADGALGSAAALNLYRAQRGFGVNVGGSIKQGMIGLVGLGLGGFLLYQAGQK